MAMDMIDMLSMMEEERMEHEYIEMEFDNWLERIQKKEEFINNIDLEEIECIVNYWKPTEAVRFLSKLVTTIVTM